jgi:tripartite ATP-independent transporter DctP family solute receptor
MHRSHSAASGRDTHATAAAASRTSSAASAVSAGRATRLLATAAIAACSVAALTFTSLASAQTTLRFGHLHSVDSPVHKGIAKAAEELQKSTAGRYKMEIYPSSQLGSGREMMTQTMNGSLDFIVEGPGFMGQLVRPLGIFEAPFIARDWPHVEKMLASPFAQKQFTEMAQKHNMRHVATFYYGVRHFTTRNKPLVKPEDAKGLKLRVPEAPVFLEMVRALGATPTPMSLGEVYLSLQTGVVDGQENPLPTINNNKFFEVQKYLNMSGHIVVPLLIMMNEKAWTAMSEADRKAVLNSFVEGAKVNDGMTRELEARLADEFKAKGMTIVATDRVAFAKAMDPLYKKFADVWGPDTVQQLQALK